MVIWEEMGGILGQKGLNKSCNSSILLLLLGNSCRSGKYKNWSFSCSVWNPDREKTSVEQLEVAAPVVKEDEEEVVVVVVVAAELVLVVVVVAAEEEEQPLTTAYRSQSSSIFFLLMLLRREK